MFQGFQGCGTAGQVGEESPETGSLNTHLFTVSVKATVKTADHLLLERLLDKAGRVVAFTRPTWPER